MSLLVSPGISAVIIYDSFVSLTSTAGELPFTTKDAESAGERDNVFKVKFLQMENNNNNSLRHYSNLRPFLSYPDQSILGFAFYFSGINPRGENLSTKSKIKPIVKSRMCATLSIRCSRNALSSAIPIVIKLIRKYPIGST